MSSTSSKPISSIIYADPATVNYHFQILVGKGIITQFSYIVHDSDGKKPHCHIWVDPRIRLDLDDFVFVPSSDDPTINACKPWRKSIFDDWLLYAIHNRFYCSAKGIEGKHEYSLSEVYFSSDDLKQDAIDVLTLSESRYASPVDKMIQCYIDGLDALAAMSRLRIPFGAMHSFLTAWNLLFHSFKDTVGDYNT